MNNFNLIGRLTKDPLIFNNSTLLVKFTLAVKSSYKDKDGEYKTDFLNCTAWGKTAEVIRDHLTKGVLIGVTGRIAAAEYEKDGVKIYNNVLIVDKIDFCQAKASGAAAPIKSNNSFTKEDMTPVDDGDIPF